jgi:hypothetical protein|tara:strand:- start:1612 stop:1731 length:120 start_codon:yes stop_codon:yes gene_type:complete
MDSIFDTFVPSYFEVGNYEIIILQNPEGDLITLKIEVYE